MGRRTVAAGGATVIGPAASSTASAVASARGATAARRGCAAPKRLPPSFAVDAAAPGAYLLAPMPLALVCLGAFLLGAVPFALLVVRVCKGVDVRTVGSGNVGATNASRAFASKGGRLGAFLGIYLLDALKGFAPALWGPLFAGVAAAEQLAAGVLLGLCAVLGHVFTPFLGFRGGKGVATATGALFALDWRVTAVGLGVFFVVRLLTGHVFFGSIALGFALPVAAYALAPEAAFAARLPFTALCLLLAVFLLWTHRSNLRKHFAGKATGTA
jgi:glycerol-3-phosphate acyltransferase PlsY